MVGLSPYNLMGLVDTARLWDLECATQLTFYAIGIGMGGQMDYFGLWIDQNFETGHSRAGPKSTTFNSNVLASESDFKIDTVEGMHATHLSAYSTRSIYHCY